MYCVRTSPAYAIHGQKCTDPSIELLKGIDASQVPGIILSCGPSFIHAHQGTVTAEGSDNLFDALKDNSNRKQAVYMKKRKGEEIENYAGDWWQFLEDDLPRGNKIMLMNINATNGHPATVYTNKNRQIGETAKIYAGDSRRNSGVFRKEFIESYFTEVSKIKNPEQRKVIVLSPINQGENQ